MAAWHAYPIYQSKLDPNTGYFNAWVDRNDDLIKLPAIQIAEAGTHLPNRDYLAIINNDLSDIVFKLYNDGKFELSDGSAFTTVLDSSNDLSSVSDTDLISAKAALAAIDAAIASNDTIDAAARTAVETAMSVITDAITVSVTAETTRATAAEASLQASIDDIPALVTTAIANNDVLDAAAREAVTTAYEAADNALTASVNTLISQVLPSSSMFTEVGNDYVVSGLLVGHAGGSLLEVSTGDIIFPTAPTGFPEASFSLSVDNTEIIFGE